MTNLLNELPCVGVSVRYTHFCLSRICHLVFNIATNICEQYNLINIDYPNLTMNFSRRQYFTDMSVLPYSALRVKPRVFYHLINYIIYSKRIYLIIIVDEVKCISGFNVLQCSQAAAVAMGVSRVNSTMWASNSVVGVNGQSE